MYAQQKPIGRQRVIAALLFLALCTNLSTAAPEPRPNPQPIPDVEALTEEAINATTLDISSLRQVTDSDCSGYEGQWNCLSDTFQHCSGGKWTSALSCSGDSGSQDTQNTLCTPLGRTEVVDFKGECSAAWSVAGSDGLGGSAAWSVGGGGWGGGGTRCNGRGCYYGAGANLTVERWIYFLISGVVALGFF
ncbi:uncharacterized protein CTRU02_208301 [Colletotrichum truncatum]|uniref:Uncharacterized protein n=1 Tax=Colletotrichum truncatum TaxID=5467 RepID=A0ACC3YW28_COLTU|nr:uncharacterized protein CTRU02_07519 [Colletotrichum truncatum]KAF6791179.1 hypothetical protein CTRU02_07519 [Colletotrichum truncatum]